MLSANLWSAAVLLAAAALGWHFLKFGRNRGPVLWPLLGCLAEILSHLPDIHDWVHGYILEHGTWRLMIFGNIGLFTADPANIEHILKTNFGNYPKGPDMLANFGPLLGGGIFNSDGGSWRAQRKAASHEFSARSLRELAVRANSRELRQRLAPFLALVADAATSAPAGARKRGPGSGPGPGPGPGPGQGPGQGQGQEAAVGGHKQGQKHRQGERGQGQEEWVQGQGQEERKQDGERERNHEQEHCEPLEFDMQDVLLRFSLDVICLTGFGVDPGCLCLPEEEGKGEGGERTRQKGEDGNWPAAATAAVPSLPEVPFAVAFDRATLCSFKRFNGPPFFWHVKRWLGVGSERELNESLLVVDHFTSRLIRARKQELASVAAAQQQQPQQELEQQQQRQKADSKNSERGAAGAGAAGAGAGAGAGGGGGGGLGGSDAQENFPAPKEASSRSGGGGEGMGLAAPEAVDRRGIRSDLLSRFMLMPDAPSSEGGGVGVSGGPSGDGGLSEEGGPSDKFLRDVVTNFVLAGRDTASVALTWFYWVLSQHPDVEQKILDEVERIVAARRRGTAAPAAAAPAAPADAATSGGAVIPEAAEEAREGAGAGAGARAEEGLAGARVAGDVGERAERERLWALGGGDYRRDRGQGPHRSNETRRAGGGAGGGCCECDMFSYEELRQMHYLHAALSEGMRLHPPVPSDTKQAARADTWPDGTRVPAGAKVTYHIYSMGRLPRLWGPDWHRFRPERWLDARGEFVPVSPFKYPVFNAGPRTCLGKDMAYLQMKAVVAGLVRHFQLSARRGFRAHYRPAIALFMAQGLPMTVRRRRSSSSSSGGRP